jgi:Cellulase (glycosyl hydrolase family 5)
LRCSPAPPGWRQAQAWPPLIRRQVHRQWPPDLRDGQPWIPYGFSIYTFANGLDAFARDEAATAAAQIRAVAGAWHGNTARFQVEQDEFLYGGDGHRAGTFRAKVFAAIAYAQSLGLAVVINDTTEATDGLYTRDEPLPTAATLSFWRAMGRYRNDPDVILDPFNEPRLGVDGPGSDGDWDTWFRGGGGYIGADALIRGLRAIGWGNQLWMEAPGNLALAELVATWPRYRLSGSNIVYSYHHTRAGQWEQTAQMTIDLGLRGRGFAATLKTWASPRPSCLPISWSALSITPAVVS